MAATDGMAAIALTEEPEDARSRGGIHLGTMDLMVGLAVEMLLRSAIRAGFMVTIGRLLNAQCAEVSVIDVELIRTAF